MLSNAIYSFIYMFELSCAAFFNLFSAIAGDSPKKQAIYVSSQLLCHLELGHNEALSLLSIFLKYA